MTLSDPNKVAVIEIVLYSPLLVLTTLVGIRMKLSGGLRTWISLGILSALRIAGASLQLATISDPTNTTLFEWAAILSSVGLSPLFLATIGVLSRLDEGLDKIYKHPLGFSPTLHQLLLEGGTMVSVALIIAGGVKGGSHLADQGVFEIDSIFKAGVSVLVVVYAGLCDASTFTFIYRRCGPLKNRELFFALYASLPLIFVRLVYVLLTAYSHLSAFSITTGDTWVRFGMTVVLEVVVSIMYLTAGLIASSRKSRH